MSGSFWKAIMVIREWSGCPPGCPGVFGRPTRMPGRPSRMFRSGRESLQDVREWSGGPPGCTGVVGSHSRMFGSGRETLPDIWEWS